MRIRIKYINCSSNIIVRPLIYITFVAFGLY